MLLGRISKATTQADYDGLITHFIEVKLIPRGLFTLHLSLSCKLFQWQLWYIILILQIKQAGHLNKTMEKSKWTIKLANLNSILHNSVHMSVKYMTQICPEALPIPKSCTAAALYILHIYCVSHAACIQTLAMRWCILEFWKEYVCLYNIYSSDDEW